MVATCAIRGCKTRHAKFSGVKFYCVPFNKERRMYWLRKCPFLRTYSDNQLDSLRICSKHFQSHHISPDKKLTVDAIPTLHLYSYAESESGLFLQIQPITGSEPLKVNVLNKQVELSNSSDDTSCLRTYNVQSTLASQSKCDKENKQPPLQVSFQNHETLTSDLSHDSISLSCQETLLDTSSVNKFTEDVSSPSPSLFELNDLIKCQPLSSSTLPYINEVPSSTEKDSSLSANFPPITPTLQEPIQTPLPSTSSLPPITPIAEEYPHQKSVFVVAHSRSLRRPKEYTMSGPRIRINKNQCTPRKQKLQLEKKFLKSKLCRMELRFINSNRKSKINVQTAQYIKKYPLLSNFGKLLVDSQLRLSGKNPKGRRYTTEEKIFALSLYKLSPKSYAFLRKYIALPCKTNINSILSQIPLLPGINDFIFQHLADTAVNKSVLDKQCILLFDEMAINKNLYFNFQSGVIEGFEDLGSGKRSQNLADKSLVFMLRGLKSPWKIPIAFYFVRDGVKTLILKNIIQEINRAVFKAGFHVRATVSDQGSANVAAVNSLISDARSELLRSDSNTADILYYKIDNYKIYHIYDVPHLLKCFRNNFQKKRIVIGKQYADWSHIETLYRVDGHRGMARSTKLTDKHINPQSYDKMKVKLAAQVFSRQVSTSLHLYMKCLQELQDCHSYSVEHCDIESGFFTAEILSFVNDLFDSLNGFGYRNGGLKSALSANSEHLEFWNNALKKLHSMKFDAPNERESYPLCLKNFIHDITTIKHLWTDLQAIGLKFLSLRRLNQDPLENFFSQIRGQSGFCANPDCRQFVACVKTLLINNISTGKSLYSNCTDDKDNMLGTIQNLVQRNQFSSCTYTFSQQTTEIDTLEIPHENALQTYSVPYIAGAICCYLFPKLNSASCDACKNILLTDTVTSSHSLIKCREYDQNQIRMNYPTQNLIKLVWQCIYLIESLLPNMCNVYIYKDIITVFEKLDTTWFTCAIHKVEFLNAFWFFIIRMQVKQWCINFNRRVHNVDTRLKSKAMEDLISSKVTKGASYRSVRRKSN